MAVGQRAILNLYRNLLKESQKWKSYNYREYALRKVRHEFQQNKTMTNAERIATCYANGLESLEIIKRQVILSEMYGTRPLIIEAGKSNYNKKSSAVK